MNNPESTETTQDRAAAPDAAPLTPPPVESRHALKEWASVEQALEQGASVLLLRKGGIYEQRQGFQVEHREFWLFPTQFHQSPDEIGPAFEWAITAARHLHGDPDTVRIANYAVVTDVLRVENLEALERLTGLHPLAPPTVHARFHYKRRPYLHALVLRLLHRGEPHRIANLPAYEGCVSWVELDEALPLNGTDPVLGDAEFRRHRAEVLERLGTDGVTRI